MTDSRKLKEIRADGVSRRELRREAKDRQQGRSLVIALRANGYEEE